MKMQSFEKWFVNSAAWSWLLRLYYLPRIYSLVDPTSTHSGLELGCGQGVTTQEFLNRFPDLHLTAIDYDPDQIVRARERLICFSQRASILQGDATALDFSDSRFDTVFACNVFHHIRDYRTALSEVYRVLKPGGKLYVVDMDFHAMNPLTKKFFPPEAIFTRENFVHDLTGVGFIVERKQGDRTFFIRAGKAPMS